MLVTSKTRSASSMAETSRKRKINPHKKVRSGCETCKKRRVKCDEGRPKCSNCSQARRNCVYRQLLPSYPVFSLKESLDQSAIRFSIRDLELLHHWTSATAATIGGTEDLRVLVRDKLPIEGFANPYLLHLILAVSSLHLAYLKPNENALYSTLACHHYSTALPMFRANLQFMDETNCHVLYGSSQLLAKYAIASEKRPQLLLLSPTPDKSTQTDWLRLIKGAYLIRDTHSHLLRESPMGCTARDLWYDVPNDAQSPFEDKLDEITNLVRASEDDDAILPIYLEVLLILRHLFAHEANRYSTANTKAIFTAALARIPSDYFALLAKRKSEAVFIFAHFCIILEKMNDDSVWYMRHWSRWLFDECLRSLDKGWTFHLSWPSATIR